ncbi:GerAB/ArcD/ProY family transporter [Priestia megaterium]|uniref:GerAB/ArcD/ProY family transporter n=1 Tax=Priestia megaterium TaxID=1404 RepID=A0A6H1P2A9_PRIMG|nr:GerAB/ArcD/ProY family transporter [Priestia megaterium]QIZ07658.1 GerAB/ArcD/ProY family transporter [Priestia megaterium]
MMVRLAPMELFSLMINFLLGSAIVVGWNFETKQDVWITILLSLGLGVGIFYFYILLHSLGKWGNLIQLLELGFGKWISKLLGFIYCLYFLYIAGRVLKDFSFFIGQVLFNNIPFGIISFTFLLVVSYSCFLGIEATARSSLILCGFTCVIILVLMVFGYLSPYFELSRLTPVFRTSWKQIISSVFPTGLTFPYGELIVFTMLFPYVNDRKALRKYGWISVCTTGVLLLVAGEMILGLLSSETVSLYVFPFVKAVELTSVLDFLPHLEAFAVILNLIGGFVKISIYMYGGLMILANLFPKAKMNRQIIATTILNFLFSFTLSKNIIQHLFIGLKVVPLYLHIPLQLIIPLILVIILSIKKYIVKSL